ncbi:12437_t:CDS:2 [Dentiscutata erythropus]|uniref:12437_t:CDS:1 n=1 Tax=Dentiscutata erythropus TaxID=1348616 RepID=A0A9N9EWV8_9GLOM|nr:12437_t:CDS:2 [Dentiscutata erythropus]
MPVPAIQLSSEGYFLFHCNFITPESYDTDAALDAALESNACNRYITEPSEKNGSYYNGYLKLPSNSNFKLLLMRNSIIFFMMPFNSSSQVMFKAFDSEYINLKNSVNGSFTPDNSPFSQSIAQLNTYEFDPGQVLNSLSLIGGAWTFSVIIYKLLFGDDAIQPFGVIQKYGCCLRNRTMNNLRKSLITLPLTNNVQNSHLISDNNEISIEQLEKEINALEIFLKDYVIGAQQLENLYKSIEKSKDK